MISKTIDLGGETLHFADFGGSGPTIVLVHGLGGSHANWFALAPRLTAHGRVIAVDLPGFGLSKRSPRGTTLDVMGEALSRFIDAMSSEPVHIMGNSMGGALSVLEAARRPERIKSALLVCPALPPPPGGAKVERSWLMVLLIACAPYGHLVLGRRAKKIGPRRMVHELMRLCCVDPTRVPRDAIEAHLEIALTRSERPWADLAFSEAARSLLGRLFVGRSFRQSLKAVRPPMLILHGDRDRLVDIRASRAAVALAPQIELTELPGLGHTPQLEAPEIVGDLAAQWLGRFGAPAVDQRAEHPPQD